ncbi:MAG: hypothetical protein MI754_03100, partial [Chromatiales bacterium]|nr:hypothetical protein [Chromatiales bacterium]
MRYKLFPTICLILLLPACGPSPFLKEQSPESTLSPQELITEADKLVEQGEWQNAIDLLKRGETRYTDSPALQKRIWELSSQWQDIAQTIENKILIVETNALKQRLRLMEVLSKGDADSYLIKTRLLFWEQLLKQKSSELLACSDYQLEKEPALAKLCLDLAAEIELTPEIEQRLAAFDLRKAEQKSIQQQQSQRIQGKEAFTKNGAKKTTSKQRAAPGVNPGLGVGRVRAVVALPTAHLEQHPAAGRDQPA